MFPIEYCIGCKRCSWFILLLFWPYQDKVLGCKELSLVGVNIWCSDKSWSSYTPKLSVRVTRCSGSGPPQVPKLCTLSPHMLRLRSSEKGRAFVTLIEASLKESPKRDSFSVFQWQALEKHAKLDSASNCLANSVSRVMAPLFATQLF